MVTNADTNKSLDIDLLGCRKSFIGYKKGAFKEVLKEGFKYDDNDTVYLRALDDKKRYKGKNRDVEFRHFESIIPDLESINAQDYGIFFVVNGGGQLDKEVLIKGKVRAQYMEIDDGTFEEQLESISVFPLKPSLIIKTRKSLHTYWFIDDGDFKYWEPIQFCLVEHFKSDKSITNPSRVLRVPGFNHCKEDPIEVGVVYYEPNNRYTQRELYQCFTDEEKQRANDLYSKKHKKRSKGKTHNDPGENSSNFIIEGSRAVTLYKKACILQGQGFDDETIRLSIMSLNNNSCKPPLDESEVSHAIECAFKYEKGQAMSDNDIERKWREFNNAHINRLESTEIEVIEKNDVDIVLKQPQDLTQFHIVCKNGQPKVYDYAIMCFIKSNINMFILGGVPYIYNHGVYECDFNGVKIKSFIRSLIYPELVKAKTINGVYELLLQDSELVINTETGNINLYPKHWINFKNGFYDTINQVMIEHNPKYKAINQLDREYTPGLTYKGNRIEEWLNFAIENPQDREMLLQFIGYCMTIDTSMQKFLCLTGKGGNGKSIIIRLVQELVGAKNYSAIPIDKLEQRFYPSALHNKLLNVCADQEVSALENTSTIKKCTGEDTLQLEYKGKDPIEFIPYAKLLFSFNDIPIVKNERTNGYYRRLLIIALNKTPIKENPNLFRELSEELDYLQELSLQALNRMYAQRKIIESDNSVKLVERLRCDSDTVHAFIKEWCSLDDREHIEERTIIYKSYKKYCIQTERTELSTNSFYRALRSDGYREFKSNGSFYFRGITTVGKNPFNKENAS